MAERPAQTNCLQTANEIPPRLSPETRREFETKLNEARALFERDSQSAENIIWLGRRTAYLGRYKDAIRIYTEGIERFPSDARFYRHRGHRFITLRCFDAAVADFEKASALIRGRPDEIEPDGLPNARNIPTSTLQSNIWYHLGLAHYLKGDFRRALRAYYEAEKVSKNADMLVATTHWLYMTLRRLGKDKEASGTLLAIKDDLDLTENADYYKLIKVYKGKLKPADVWDEISHDTGGLSNATIGYGLGNWFLYNGQRAEAERVFRQITAGNQWASFGYIAAESELKRTRHNVQAVYSDNPKDSWNIIFHHLFTRSVRARVSEEFPGSGPLAKANGLGFPLKLLVSAHTFERIESGDRAIEPLYPSFITTVGTQEVVSEPRFSQLKQALFAALDEKTARPALHRALMQADLWAAHDRLAHLYKRSRTTELRDHASQLISLLARLIKKLALTPDEINGLPDNYTLAAKEHQLPDLFSPDSEWMEVRWVPNRLHDDAADFRRVTRVFLKPSVPLQDRQSFLDGLPHNHGETAQLGAVALVIQNLLIDSKGDPVPTRLTYEVQLRNFRRDQQGKLVKTDLNQYELNRKSLFNRSPVGGMISFGEDAAMYLPTAGNDYDFATPQQDTAGERSPILATLRTRCGTCHGQPNAPAVFTFSMHPREPVPPVVRFSQPNDTHARYVIWRKIEREDFKILREQWSR